MRIADRVLDALRQATPEQIVVANDQRATGWFPGERVVEDAEGGLGPLAGIATALEATRGAAVIVVAWDMPFVPGSLLIALRQRAARGAIAVVPLHGAAGVIEPLCAYYAAAALDTCRSLLAGGERRASALAEALGGAEYLGGDELRSFGDPERMFISVDSPEQLAALDGRLD